MVESCKIGDSLHRQKSLKLLLIRHVGEQRNTEIIQIRPEVNGVASQYDPPSLRKVDKTRLVARRMTWSVKDRYRTITK